MMTTPLAAASLPLGSQPVESGHGSSCHPCPRYDGGALTLGERYHTLSLTCRRRQRRRRCAYAAGIRAGLRICYGPPGLTHDLDLHLEACDPNTLGDTSDSDNLNAPSAFSELDEINKNSGSAPEGYQRDPETQRAIDLIVIKTYKTAMPPVCASVHVLITGLGHCSSSTMATASIWELSPPIPTDHKPMRFLTVKCKNRKGGRHDLRPLTTNLKSVSDCSGQEGPRAKNS